MHIRKCPHVSVIYATISEDLEFLDTLTIYKTILCTCLVNINSLSLSQNLQVLKDLIQKKYNMQHLMPMFLEFLQFGLLA